MPRPRKRCLGNNSAITSFIERMPIDSPRSQGLAEAETEVLTLDILKDVLFKEI